MERLNGRDTRSQVYFGATVLIEDTWNPEFEACRGVAPRHSLGAFVMRRPWAISATARHSVPAAGGNVLLAKRGC
jgi:hypothetical protein